jgi:cell division protease FtsH
MFLPEQDRYSTSKRRLESRIATLFGGRVAEEIVFGRRRSRRAPRTTSSGPPSSRATWSPSGACRSSGTLTYAEDDGEVFLGRSVTQHKQVDDKTRDAIDEEIRRLIDDNYERARTS